jgi:tetratricopeptide (TPR) repeat protein
LKKSSFIVLSICVILTMVAVIARIAFPEYIVTVQQFEIAPELAPRLSLTGKGASDIVIDILNRTATNGSAFKGSDYYLYDRHGAQPVALKGTIRIPVETSYGIDVNGISLDSLVRLYENIRYRRWIIGGDIVSSPEGVIAKIRLNRDGSAKSWQTEPDPHPVASRLVENATGLLLSEEEPELLGRAYLREGHYVEAAKVFRQWALRHPRDWKPFYYLSLSYDYRGDEQEANNLANWSLRIMNDQSETKIHEPRKKDPIDQQAVSGFAKVTGAIWNTRNFSDSSPFSQAEKPEDRRKRLEAIRSLSEAIPSLEILANTHQDPMYKIQWAKALDQKASLVPASATAYADQNKAVDILKPIVEQLPNNGGLHEQYGILLQHLADIAQTQEKSPDAIQAAQNKAITELTKALELRPTQLSPLWGAVYALLHSNRVAEAVDLSRTISLLQPESTAAYAAYIVSLEHKITDAPKDERGELQTEVEDHLKAVLGKASLSELDALLTSFVDTSDQKRLFETLHAYRELAKQKPEEHRPALALALNAAGELSRKNQQRDQAAGAYKEALGIYRTLAKTDPKAYEPNVIRARDALDKLRRRA